MEISICSLTAHVRLCCTGRFSKRTHGQTQLTSPTSPRPWMEPERAEVSNLGGVEELSGKDSSALHTVSLEGAEHVEGKPWLARHCRQCY